MLINLNQGYYVTNCFECNFICYDNCVIVDDYNKSVCIVMKDGFCIVCIKKCKWIVYRIVCYKFVYVIDKVKIIYIKMKDKYEKVKGCRLIYEFFIVNLLKDVEYLFVCVNGMMIKMNCCKSRFKEIVLRFDFLFMVEYLD